MKVKEMTDAELNEVITRIVGWTTRKVSKAYGVKNNTVWDSPDKKRCEENPPDFRNDPMEGAALKKWLLDKDYAIEITLFKGKAFVTIGSKIEKLAEHYPVEANCELRALAEAVYTAFAPEGGGK